MKKYFTTFIILILFFIATISAQNKKTFYAAFDSISANSIKEHLSILADDSLEGRKVGTVGANTVAE